MSYWLRRLLLRFLAASALASSIAFAQAPAPSPASEAPELVFQSGHVDWLNEVVFSADSRFLASAGRDGVVRVWEARTGRLFLSLTGYGDWIKQVSLDPAGRWLAAGGDFVDVRPLKLWALSSRQLLQTLPPSTASAFSPDGRWLASGSSEGITLYATGSWSVARTLAARPLGSQVSVYSLAFSPDGRLLVASDVGNIHVWDVNTGARIISFGKGSRRIGFTADGQLWAGNIDSTGVDLWDAVSGQPRGSLSNLERHEGTDVALSADGRWVASVPKKLYSLGTTDTMIHLWDAKAHAPVRTLSDTPGSLDRVAFSPDGTLLAAVGPQPTVNLWEVPSGRLLYRLGGRAAAVSSLALSSNGRWLGTGSGTKTFSGDTSLRLWDLGTGQVIHRFTLPWEYSEARVRFHPSRPLVASDERVVNVWDVETGKPLHSLATQGEGVFAMAYSPDGKWLLSADGKTVRVWSADTGQLQQTWNFIGVKSIAFSPRENWVALGMLEQIAIVEMATGRMLRILKPARGFIDNLVISPDERWLAAGGLISDRVTLWDPKKAKPLRSLSDFADVSALAPQGRVFATAFSKSPEIKLWNLPEGAPLRALQGHTEAVEALVFTRDGRFLISGSRDGSARIWDVASGKPLALLALMRDSADWVVATPDGFFDGSPAGVRALVAWRFASETAPLEAYFNEFYHPGLLADVLSGRQPRASQNVALLDRRQPSVALAVAGKKDAVHHYVSTRTVTLALDVAEAPPDAQRPSGSGARDVRLFRNGSLVRVWRGDVLQGQKQVTLEATVPVVAGSNRFTAYAFNRDNIKSSDAELVVSGADSLRRKGTAYILAIGINQYANRDYNLNYAVADATAFAQELSRQQAKLGQYEKVEVVPLLDQDATKSSLLGALGRLAGEAPPAAALPAALQKLQPAQPEDAVIVYYAGHGTASGPRFYLIPHDLGYAGARTALDEAGLNALLAHSISDRDLERAFEKIDAGRLLLVIDACNSGQALEAEEKRRGPMNSKGLAQLAYEKGMYILTAAQGYQAALEAAQLGHGYLTYALVEEGLKTLSADSSPKDGSVVVREWLDYAALRVPQMQEQGMEQARKLGRNLTIVEGEEQIKDLAQRSLQRPRVFYRREPEAQPLVVAKP